MKTNIFCRRIRIIAGLALALLLGNVGIAGEGETFPLGTWDLKMSRARQGTAYLTFNGDGSISGYEIFGPVPQGANAFVPVPRSSLFGSAVIEGTWNFDRLGKVIGYYIETGFTSGQECTTNVTVTTITETVTNGGIVTNITMTMTNLDINCITNGFTNGVSFVAKGRLGKNAAMKMTASTEERIVGLKGKPFVFLPDITGDYYGKALIDGILVNEFFTLALTDFPVPNAYDVNGTGPGYSFMGTVLLSANGQFSFVSLDDSTNSIIRELNGPIVTKSLSSLTPKTIITLKGQSAEQAKILEKVSLIRLTGSD